MTDKILTLHPEGKQGVNIDRQKYEWMKAAILETLTEEGPTPFKELGDRVSKRLPAEWEGSLMWYLTTVKLDLEARNLIRRSPVVKPQVVELVE